MYSFTYGEVTGFLARQLSHFRAFKNAWTEILQLCQNNDYHNGLALHSILWNFLHLFNTFVICGVEFDYLRRSYRRFRMTTQLFWCNEKYWHKTYHYVKITWVPNDINKASYFAFFANVQLCLPQASGQAFSCFQNSSSVSASFSLLIVLVSCKRTRQTLLSCTTEYLSILCSFGYYQKHIK